MSKPDTNQASEDELEHEIDDIVHDALGEVFCHDCEHPRCLNKVKLYKKAIQTLIRTEKLKLLAEVRERVVGEDVTLNSFEIPVYEGGFVITSVTQQNNLRADQRILLDKLEAEL